MPYNRNTPEGRAKTRASNAKYRSQPGYKERRKEYQKKWYQKNKIRKNIINKEWIKNNLTKHKEYCRIYARKWREKHPERSKEINNKSIEKNRDKINQRKREYHHRNKDKISKKAKLYRETHREKIRAEKSKYKSRRRAIIFKNKIEETGSRYHELQKEPFCFWCNESLNKSNRHVDHVIPLALGGKEASRNLVASCATCNMSKNDLHPIKWLDKIEKSKKITAEQAQILRDQIFDLINHLENLKAD